MPTGAYKVNLLSLNLNLNLNLLTVLNKMKKMTVLKKGCRAWLRAETFSRLQKVLRSVYSRVETTLKLSGLTEQEFLIEELKKVKKSKASFLMEI